MKHEYKVGQKVRITKLYGADRAVGINIGDIVTVGVVIGESIYSKKPLAGIALFLFDQIEPIKRGRPTKKIAKPKAEPKILGYVIAYSPNISKTLAEATSRFMEKGFTNSHIFAVTKEFEVITTSELKEVKVKGGDY